MRLPLPVSPARIERSSLAATRRSRLRQGEPVELHFRLPQGLRLAGRLYVRRSILATTAMPSGSCGTPRTGGAYEGHMPDFNFFNVKRSELGA